MQGRLHEVRTGCRNPRERCDAAFLENREPGDRCVCRKDFLWKSREKFLGKLYWEKSGEVDHRGMGIFANGISLGSAMK